MPQKRTLILLSLIGSFISIVVAISILQYHQRTKTDAQTVPPTNQLPIKDTAYPIPNTNVFFVSPTGNDTNSGTQTFPWQTIRKAITTAPTGATIVIRQGVYREGEYWIETNRTPLNIGKRLTIQPYPHEKVWMKGTLVVTDWVQEGTLWRKDNWKYKFRQDSLDGAYLRDTYPMADNPDMVFIDGKPLKQVGSKTNLAADSFYVNYSTTNKQIYLGTNPAGKTVEVTAFIRALTVSASDVTVRGLGFMQYGSHYFDFGMLRTTAPRTTFEDNTVAWNATQGMGVYAADAIVRGNQFLYNGLTGFGAASRADRLLFERNYLAHNNQEHFAGWAAAGTKMANSRDMIWRDNISEYNIDGGKGFWCDVDCYNTTIVRNIARFNSGHGIMYEISEKGIIASNISVGNGTSGIYISESGNMLVYNNTLVRNNQDIRVIDKRTSSNPEIPHETKNNIIVNNILSNTTNNAQLLFTEDYATGDRKTGDEMISTLDYNAYYRTSSTAPATLIQWSGGNASDKLFKTLAEFRSATGKEQHGIEISNQPTNPFFINESAGNYNLRSDSTAKKKGQPLPANVAAAIGVTAGVPVDMGALLWPEDSETTPAPSVTPFPTIAKISVPLRIDSGATTTYTDSAGNTWQADKYFIDGNALGRPTVTITNTQDQKIYQTERWALNGYSFPINNGSYLLKLHFAETYEQITAPDQRVFSVDIEGQTALNNFDIFQEANGTNKALIKTIPVSVSDNTLDIEFIDNVQQTVINGIEILPATAPTETQKTITIRLLLHGIGKAGDNVNPSATGNMNPLRTTRNVTIEFFNANNQLVATHQTPVTFSNTTGEFTGSVPTEIAPGVYSAKAKAQNYLKRAYTGIISLSSGQTTLPAIALVTGDTNNDNLLSIVDYNILLDCFSDLSPARNCGDPAKKQASDLTDDGNVNQFDYNLFLRELSVQTGQ